MRQKHSSIPRYWDHALFEEPGKRFDQEWGGLNRRKNKQWYRRSAPGLNEINGAHEYWLLELNPVESIDNAPDGVLSAILCCQNILKICKTNARGVLVAKAWFFLWSRKPFYAVVDQWVEITKKIKAIQQNVNHWWEKQHGWTKFILSW